MQPDSTTISAILTDPLKLVQIIGGIVAIIAGLVAIIAGILGLIRRLKRWCQIRREQRRLLHRPGAEFYTPEEIIFNSQYYVRPFCQDVDPSQEAEIRLVHAVQADLFDKVDYLLAHPEKYKYSIVLADSGMGKTAFLINYWLRHWRDKPGRRRFKLALVPLGMEKADNHIQNISDKSNTVLFLDAFDEDARAIQNYRQRLARLLKLSEDFRQVLLTSRTQFFLREEEIPRETGIIRISSKGLGESGEWLFYKLYLAPFSDAQVEQYLKLRFTFFRRKQRTKARELVRKIPLLSVRPMILTHIQDLVQSEKEFKYAFQLYEEMVTAWLEREKPFVKDTVALRKFSECLAIDLYSQKNQRGAERVHYSELLPLARDYKIPLEDWQLRGRSLLNRDVAGNYKFAHRSIMEYLFVKRFLETEPNLRPKTDWTDLMKNFFVETLQYCQDINQGLPNLSHVDLSGIFHSQLRANRKKLTQDEGRRMLIKYDFYDKYENKAGKGIKHLYFQIGQKDEIIFDLSTGLMWQQSGSLDSMTYDAAKEWVEGLNEKGYAGYHDWRLPTLEEAMSLMEPTKNKAGLYIDLLFDSRQHWIWTVDIVSGQPWAWVVSFGSGRCLDARFYGYGCVRAVRSAQSFEK